jgi:anti-sigma regulatory factor (Ser/Thr protein kinase)
VRILAGAVPDPIVEDVEIIASELTTNVVKHAGLEPGDPFEVRISLRPPVLRIEVLDEGATEVSEEPESWQRAHEELAEGGWGLSLVSALASRCSVKKVDGTAAWAEIVLPEVPSPGAGP